MGSVEKSKENLGKCLCMKCPSYTFARKVKSMPSNVMDMMEKDVSKVDHIEALFCAFGKSKYITDEKGCICAGCKVYKENNLSSLYYCLGGK